MCVAENTVRLGFRPKAPTPQVDRRAVLEHISWQSNNEVWGPRGGLFLRFGRPKPYASYAEERTQTHETSGITTQRNRRWNLSESARLSSGISGIRRNSQCFAHWSKTIFQESKFRAQPGDFQDVPFAIFATSPTTSRFLEPLFHRLANNGHPETTTLGPTEATAQEAGLARATVEKSLHGIELKKTTPRPRRRSGRRCKVFSFLMVRLFLIVGRFILPSG